MAANLVVVESRAKATTIEKYLGRNYTVRACFGHVRDLPSSKLGVDVDHGFEPQYVIPKDRKDIVKRLKEDARGKSTVLLATDPDREGEAIAWHLISALGLDGQQEVRRIEFHEITKAAIQEAMKNPREIDIARVDAQQARRVLDRLIGYPVSNFLGRKVRRGLSAGRVQSVAVRMVVDREREILAFVPVEYWTVEAVLQRQQANAGSFTAGLVERAGEKIELHTGVEASAVQADLQGARWSVTGVKEQERQRHPDAPFTTSTLQQEASRKLGFSPRQTMAVAQQLYEGIAPFGGLITYMRTDSVNIAQEAQQRAREYIRTKLEKGMLPEQPRTYRTRSKLAQEAHEAIRPTDVFNEPDAVQAAAPELTRDQFRLYELIWKRFLASQMTSAIFDVTTVDVDAQATAKPLYRFRATGSRLKFAGFLSLYRVGVDEEEATSDEERQPLPALTAGDPLNLLRLVPEQHFTQPPPRFTEATLVKAMEERGIGRPSTYAPILTTIQERGYVERENRRLKPTDIGMLVNDLLVRQFGDIVDFDFTANLEDKLDEVAQGERPWAPLVQELYGPLKTDLDRAEVEVERVNNDVPTDEVCSQGHPMVIKEGRFGRFLACTMYPEHKETRPLAEELPSDAPEEHCSHGVVMQLRTGRFGPFYTSTHDCGETRPFARRVGVPCPTDGGEILEKRSKKGKTFYGCGNWPDCDWVSWNRPVPEPCPQCGGMQVEMGRGKLRCLKHEGEPKRFVRNGKVADGKVANAKVANGKVASGKVANGKVASGKVASSAAKKRKAPTKRAS